MPATENVTKTTRLSSSAKCRRRKPCKGHPFLGAVGARRCGPRVAARDSSHKPMLPGTLGTRQNHAIRDRGNCSDSRRWTRWGPFANDENEAAPGRRVANPPLRQVGQAPEGGLQTRPYARSVKHRNAGCKPAPTPGRLSTGRRVANPPLRQVGQAPECGLQTHPYARSAKHRKAGCKPAPAPARPRVILRETLNSYR